MTARGFSPPSLASTHHAARTPSIMARPISAHVEVDIVLRIRLGVSAALVFAIAAFVGGQEKKEPPKDAPKPADPPMVDPDVRRACAGRLGDACMPKDEIHGLLPCV